ncbi:MAG: GNAT family N-acetyltransferase [Spirochaetales bacterium]|nr:GNAT family N-acetyltransferase [Spirochaetales bacterium]
MTNRDRVVGGPVAVLHGAVAPDARKDELDVLVQVQAVSDSLRRLGFEPAPLPMDLDLGKAAETLRRMRPILVFNLVESIGGRDRLMVLAPALLEALHLPYTGCSSAAVALSGGKLAAKRLLRRAGIPTPAWAGPPELEAGAAQVSFPALLKSGWDHASFGLEELYGSARELREAWQERLGGTAREDAPPGDAARADAPPAMELFAESYVDGREFNLSVLEEEGRPRVLPPAEMRFVDYPQGKPRIVGYAAKWDQGSFEYTHTVRRFDFEAADRRLLERLVGLARRCWGLFELSGYARVDFRVDPAGLPWVLEVNVNPCLSPDAGFAAAAERAGLSYDEVVERLVEAALTRGAVGPPEEPRSVAQQGVPGGWSFRDTVLGGDVAAVRDIVESSGFFSQAEIQLAAELVQERLERGEASGYHFLFAEPPETPGRPEGYTCFGVIPCTEVSYDLYWIAVRGGGRGRGVGTVLLRQTEERIRRLGGRRIYVETSSRPQYEPTRLFYASRGYRVETVLEDFYAPGDGKVIFVKEIE